MAHPERGASGYAMETEHGIEIWDCGGGTLHRYLRAGLRLEGLRALYITHHHADHVSDLPLILQTLIYQPGLNRSAPLLLHGPAPVRAYFDFCSSFFGLGSSPFPISFTELEPGCSVEHPAGSFTVYPTVHTEGSLAFRLETTDGILAYSGDTDVCDGVREAARGADLFLCECSFPDGGKLGRHLTAGEAGRIAAEAGARRIVLTHRYAECDGVDVVGQCRRAFPGEVTLAEDFLELQTR
jgi:ribonuclease BN (tRNA processing enzyme)